MRVKNRLQQLRPLDGDFSYQLPGDLVLGGAGAFRNKGVDAVFPRRHLFLQHTKYDDRVAGGSYGSICNGIGQFLDGCRVIPKACRRGLRHFMQRALVGCGRGLRHGFLLFHACPARSPWNKQSHPENPQAGSLSHKDRADCYSATFTGFDARFESSAATAMASAFRPSSPDTRGGRSFKML